MGQEKHLVWKKIKVWKRFYVKSQKQCLPGISNYFLVHLRNSGVNFLVWFLVPCYGGIWFYNFHTYWFLVSYSVDMFLLILLSHILQSSTQTSTWVDLALILFLSVHPPSTIQANREKFKLQLKLNLYNWLHNVGWSWKLFEIFGYCYKC